MSAGSMDGGCCVLVHLCQQETKTRRTLLTQRALTGNSQQPPEEKEPVMNGQVQAQVAILHSLKGWICWVVMMHAFKSSTLLV